MQLMLARNRELETNTDNLIWELNMGFWDRHHLNMHQSNKNLNIGVTFVGKWSFVSHRATWGLKECN